MKIEIRDGGIGSGIITFLVIGFFIPELAAVVVVLFLIFGVLDWLGAVNTTNPSFSKRRFNVPVIPLPSGVCSLTVSPPPSLSAPGVSQTSPPKQMSPKDQEEVIRAALQKAKRMAHCRTYEQGERKCIFERVFRQECQGRGIKIAEFKWNRRERTAGEALPAESGKNLSTDS